MKKFLKKIINTKNKEKIALNSGWLILDKFIKIFFGVLIGIWVARYLGPTDFGKLKYVIAIVSLLSPLFVLGLNISLPKELIKNEEKNKSVLFSAFFLKLTGSFLILILVFLFINVFYPEDKVIGWLAFFISAAYVFKTADVIDYWFLSKLKSKYTVIAKNTGLFFSSLLQIVFILSGFSVIYFGFALTVESFIFAVVLFSFFIAAEKIKTFNLPELNIKEVFNLLKESWIYIFFGFFNIAFFNIDKIMIENQLDAYNVGLYSVSSMILFSFVHIGNSITRSVYPVLLSLDKNSSFDNYKDDFQKLFDYMTIFAYIIIFVTICLSGYIIPVLWGKEYAFSSDILYIQIFSLVFIFLGLCYSQWIIIKDLMKFFLGVIITGAFLNILLNFFLIKAIGVKGAAFATVFSFFLVYIMSCLFHPELRKIFKIQLKALFLVNIFKIIFYKIKNTLKIHN